MEPQSWIGIAGLAIPLLFIYLNKREANRHDDEIKALKTENAVQAMKMESLERGIQDCEEDRKKTKVELRECYDHHAATDREVKNLKSDMETVKFKLEDQSQH